MNLPAVPRPEFTLRAGSVRFPLGRRTLVMGILNCTPDSFADGGLYVGPEAALRRWEQIAEEGADWIDLGGESTRPGALAVSAEEEWARIGPVLTGARKRGLPLPVSVDTTKSEVASRALDAGAVMINDVSGLCFDPALADLAAQSGAALVIMHMKGEPRTMQLEPSYADVVQEVAGFLQTAVELAASRGVAREQILIDPGLGFGKTAEHNLQLLRGLPALRKLNLPILVGASRKSFIGKLLDLPVAERLEGSIAAHVAAALAGAHAVRTHDVRATIRALRIVDAILGEFAPEASPMRTS